MGCEFYFSCIKGIQSDKIEHFKCFGVINANTIFTAVFLKYGHESSRMRTFAEGVSVGGFEFKVFDVALLLALKVVDDAM